jgi:hypothetical protein
MNFHFQFWSQQPIHHPWESTKENHQFLFLLPADHQEQSFLSQRVQRFQPNDREKQRWR